jgi:hypothetical protein
VSGRRGFLKGFGILSAVFSGGAIASTTASTPAPSPVAVNPSSNDLPVKEDISHLAPPKMDVPVFAITGSYGEDNKPQPTYPGSPYMFAPLNPKVTNKVNMAVGRDNRLWLEIDGEWRRVAVE